MEQTEQFPVAGIMVQVIRKPIRHAYLRVLSDGRVQISAPKRASIEELRQFAESRAVWISKHRQACLNRAVSGLCCLLPGDVIWVWGRPCRLELQEGGPKGDAFLEGDRIVLAVPAGSGFEVRWRIFDAWRRQEFLRAVEPVLQEGERVVGVQAAEWMVHLMKTRWGSCNPARRKINFNLQLLHYPSVCLRYVVLHELTHILEPSHNARFWGCMDAFCPDWKKAREELKRPLQCVPATEGET